MNRINICVGIALSLTVTASLAADTAHFLDSKLGPISDHKEVGSLWRLCQKIQKPCGLEQLVVNDPSLIVAKGEDGLGKKSIRQLLDRIVSEAPKYRWELRTEVINIEPKVHEPEDLLGRKLPNLSLPAMSSTRAALHILHRAGLLGSFQGPGNFRLRKIGPLKLNDVTVREALNAVVAADGRAMWVISPGTSGRVSLFFASWGNGSLKGAEYEADRKMMNEEWADRKIK